MNSNKQKVIKELKFWNTLCGCALIAGCLASFFAQLEYKSLVAYPLSYLFWVLNIPLLIGLLFLIPLTMSSNIIDKIDENIPQ
jgi:H+/Cl- antiporter ClcA